MKRIEQYDIACVEISRRFWEKYFKEEGDDWVHEIVIAKPIRGEYNGIWCFHYEFWRFDEIVLALRLKATKEQLDGYYWGSVERHNEGKSRISFENFLEYGWVKE